MAKSEQAVETAPEATLIDCDVHQGWASEAEIAKYLPDHYRDRGITPPGTPGWDNPVAAHGLGRTDSVPEDGGPPGSSYELLEAQLLDDFGVDYAVLTGPLTNFALAVHPNTDYATAAIEAYNDWLIEEWLERDERFLGALMVVPAAPDHAVDEIERVGSHEQMVQVMMPGAHEVPYGHRRYWPIYGAAEAAGLPMGTHSSVASTGVASQPVTGAGIPMTYAEKHANAPATQMGQLSSIVYQGVFEEYPDLEWVFTEQRLGWIPGMLWQMDKDWKGLQETMPWLDRRPSEYVREHVWFSTQPMIEPEEREHLLQMLEMLHAEETLVFSSDYPHWDNDNPKAVLRTLDAETRRRIFSENARRVYGL